MRQKPGFKLRQLGDEYILTAEGASHVNFNKLMVMNHSAAYLWRSVAGNDFDAERLAALLVQEYAIDEAAARHDAEAIMQSWEEAGLICGS